MFGFGLVLFTRIESDEHLLHILFGNLLGIPDNEFYEVVVIAIVVLIAVLIRRRDLLVYCFDPQHARAIGLPVGLLHYGLLALLSLAIVASLKAVGLILVIAMLVAPGATAFLLTRRFDLMLVIAGIVAIGSSVAGTLMSFHLDAATGPSIVLIQAGVFALALVMTRVRQHITGVVPRPQADRAIGA
jgi:manganese/iron transport system permease protein